MIYFIYKVALLQTKRNHRGMCLVTWGLELTYFKASVGLFLEIPDEQFNLDHWALGYSLLKKQDAKT